MKTFNLNYNSLLLLMFLCRVEVNAFYFLSVTSRLILAKSILRWKKVASEIWPQSIAKGITWAAMARLVIMTILKGKSRRCTVAQNIKRNAAGIFLWYLISSPSLLLKNPWHIGQSTEALINWTKKKKTLKLSTQSMLRMAMMIIIASIDF